MSNRVKALKRVLLVIPLVLLVYLSAFLFYVIFVPYFIIDVVVQFITGGEGLPSDGLGLRVYEWFGDNTEFVIFGKGQWKWTP